MGPAQIALNDSDARHGNLAVIGMSFAAFVVVAAEFMPVSLLTQIAADLNVTEGQVGLALAMSGFCAIATGLFGGTLAGKADRRFVLCLYLGMLVLSSVCAVLAPNYMVFLIGRAFIGITVGGFWSMATAAIARLVPSAGVPRALVMLQSGTALAVIIAAPAGSLLGGIVGWRGAFATLVPLGVIAMLWLIAVLPRLPAGQVVPVAAVLGVLRGQRMIVAMSALFLFFFGQFAIFTFIRPYLEFTTGLGIPQISLMLFVIGISGLAGNIILTPVIRTRTGLVLAGSPLVMGATGAALIAFGTVPWIVAMLLVLWGFAATPTPAAWGAWTARNLSDRLEAAGGLQVVVIQLAIGAGSALGGVLYDAWGWQAAFVLGAVALGIAGLLALGEGRTPVTIADSK